ncbi:response regulator transcription factor [Bifidobacterium moraviense]|nr:response regulator transcription factor [Bifidobacterium sp. DSM 109958]
MGIQSASARTGDIHAGGIRTVGIVDNDPFTLSALRDVIGSMLGYRTLWAERSAVTALGLCAEDADAPDVLLTDVMMPDMSGITLCRLIRARTASVPVLAITSYNLDVHARRAAEAGAQGIVNKDDPAVIAAAVAAVASGTVWPYRPSRDGGDHAAVTFSTAAVAHRQVSASRAQRAIAALSRRELDVVRLTCETLAPFSDIAVRLGCGESTVKTLAQRAYRKLGVTNRRELMALWTEGLLS